jgi:tetratricopeptide (TPR) repeat protein
VSFGGLAVTKRWLLFAGILTATGGLVVLTSAQTPPAIPKGGAKDPTSDIELVEKLNATRKQYQMTLEQLRKHYINVGDIERSKWVEDELLQYHRLMKYAYRLDIVVPVPTLQAKQNIPEANDLFREAMSFKDKGRAFGSTDSIDNQRRAELLLQRLLDKYPESDKIGETAYHLGDIYEKYKPTPQYQHAAVYFERSVQWNRISNSDARMRAAKIYDSHLHDREKAKTIYKEILTHDTDNNRIAEARKRLEELQK